MPPRTRVDADERATIIKAAYARMASPGAEPVSVAAILTEAGLSTRAFYRHFASKDELFLAMLEQDSHVVVRRLRELADEPGDATGRLTACVHFFLGLVYDPRSRAHITVLDSNEVRTAKGYREANTRHRMEREEVFAEIIRAGAEDGSFTTARPVPDAAAIHALLDRAIAGPLYDFDLAQDELVGYVVDFALRALGARI